MSQEVVPFFYERARADSVAKVAAQAAHDIKEPLGALNVLQTNPGVDSERARNLHEKIVQQVRGIAEAILTARRALN